MESRICLVDDDESIRDALGSLFRSRRLKLTTYADPERFLSTWLHSDLREVPAALILDVRMPRLSGVELFAQMKQHGLPPNNAVLFLTGHGEIPLAVEAIKGGAYDFLEKPFSDNSLVDRVLQALAHAEALLGSGETRMAQAFAALTPRQREIAERIVAGKTNRMIAAELFISVRTVEVHRAQLFDRLDIHSALELVPFLQIGGAFKSSR